MAEVNEIELSEFVQSYLEPIPGNSPAGSDAANTEEYFKLNMEIPKVTPDYRLCKELSSTILLEKSKDLKIASWLCFVLFRLDKMKGFKEGLNIIYNLLIKYQNNLFPINDIHRSKALQFLNTPRVFKLVEREEINSSNASDVIESNKLLSLISDECHKLFPGNFTGLKQLQEVLETQFQKANQLAAGAAVKKDEKEAIPLEDKTVKEEKPIKPEEEKIVVTPSGKIEDVPKVQTAAASSPASAPLAKDFKVATEKEAVIQLKQLLAFFFEESQDGVKKEKVPSSSFVFGFSRQLVWERLMRPVETDKVTQIAAPNQVALGKIREWFSSGNWDALIPRIEINLLKSDSEFIYWLDAHRYVSKALEQKGGIYLQASEDIKYHLSRLLKKIPDLAQLKFKDKQTPFADSETIKWINDEVKNASSGSTKNDIVVLPPIFGEDYDPINKEYEAACSELPEKFEENLLLMQKSIEADTRIKGRFLRKLNLANYFIQAKQFNLAEVYLAELKNNIDELNLTEWEPALCTAVWESLYIVNSYLIAELKDDESKKMLEKEQKMLFCMIANYNGLLALKIVQKTK